MVKTAAPQPEPGAKLFDPKKVPAMQVSGGSAPVFPPPTRLGNPPNPGGSGPSAPIPAPPGTLTQAQRLEQEFERLGQAFDQFLHDPGPDKHPTQRLLVLYASLAGKTAMPSKDLGDRPIYFHVDTPLTKSELLYAIESTFTLNNLAIIPMDDDRIRLGTISEVLRSHAR